MPKKKVTAAPPTLCQHAARLEAAREAVDRLHTDPSVDTDTTRASLEDIVQHCETLIEGLDEGQDEDGDDDQDEASDED
jgi:hypothetical protein